MKRTCPLFRAKTDAAPRFRRARLEQLERRDLLSVTAGGLAFSEPAPDAESAYIAPAEPTGSVQLAAPSLSRVTAGGGFSHYVAWTAVENATGYQLAFSTDGENWESLTTGGTSTLLSDLVCGNRISYRVRALKSGGSAASEWSAVQSLYVCPVDVDGDGFIGPGDRALLSQAWFSNEESEDWNPACDIDGDGFVGPGDLSYVSETWFKSREEIAVTSLGLIYDGESVFVWNTEEVAAPIRGGDILMITSPNGKSETISISGVWDSYFVDAPAEPGTYRYAVSVTRPGALYSWEGELTVVVPPREAAPEDLTLSLAWDSAGYGLALTWTANSELQKDALLRFYFASGASVEGIVDDPDILVTIPAAEAGQSGVILIEGTKFYTEVPVNTFDKIVALLGDDLVASIDDVKLSIGRYVKQEVVNQSTYDAIKYAARSVGKTPIYVTSGWRNSYEEADATFYNLARPDVRAALATQYAIYGRAGDQVIAVFEEYAILYDYDNATIRSHASEIIRRMADKIDELDAQGLRVSRHCVREEVYREHNIIDISRSGFNQTSVSIFTAALKRMGGTYVLDEASDNCLHLEF